jgi:hypothetical protein
MSFSRFFAVLSGMEWNKRPGGIHGGVRRMTLQKLDKATERLEAQGPISVMGTMFQTFY